jgi:hypothetical protein
MEDLGNYAAPQNAVQANISGTLFTKWMIKYTGNANCCDPSNPFQIVAMLSTKTVNWGGMEIKPNWHLTMMGNRDSTVSINFHFKVEIGKPISHYWHYVLYRDPGTKTWSWVGDANPLIPATNQGGGGAGNDVQLLKSNLSLVTSVARQQNMDGQMTKKIQNKMVAVLTKWDKDGALNQVNNVWTGGGG